MLTSGQADSLKAITLQEGVDSSYISRMMNLTCLTPDIAQAILDDTLPDDATLFALAADTPRLWSAQRAKLLDHQALHNIIDTAMLLHWTATP